MGYGTEFPFLLVGVYLGFDSGIKKKNTIGFNVIVLTV